MTFCGKRNKDDLIYTSVILYKNKSNYSLRAIILLLIIITISAVIFKISVK
jgi:hypothetical protein